MKKNLKRMLKTGDQLQLHIGTNSGDTHTLLSALETIIDNDKIVINARLTSAEQTFYSNKPVSLTTQKETTGILNMNGHITQVDRNGNEVVLVVSLSDNIEQTQRREDFRLPILREVKIAALGDQVLEGVTQNISAGGMRCMIQTPIEEGQTLDIIVTLDLFEYTFKGRVLETINHENQASFILRIAFEELSPVEKKKLVAFIFSEQSRQKMMSK
ncbi:MULTISPECIES: flagellar brake protein [unclassified Fusibacter]|uniref:flagellar brake protein n=1 Tax=unclassified Fusibacter TaxID=2624464 RepID=UPI0013E93283|nr:MULTISPECIES: PilZ domain-containing protein [unclassified Fusibacter]MCK8058624.1 PilZ domain-containing protein [Fusibacter sp. A2]NPE21699.1 PilZ domain-containing protein [Fusibacter sp. A1]